MLLLNTLILFACGELAARGVFQMAGVLSQPTEPLRGEGNPREKASYYSSQDWGERYWQEFRLSNTQRYTPFVGWRRAPFQGDTIAIDQHGVRVTPGADCRATSWKVFTFGASEMWGTGAPNWGTIPAYLQQGLEKRRQGPVCVMNFAESAYVSMQDVLMLLLQLRSGNVPDVVLFYDIGGDIAAAYQSWQAGVSANLAQLAAKFEGRQQPWSVVEQLRKTYAYALIDKLVGALWNVTPPQAAPTPLARGTDESLGLDVAALSDAIVQEYLGTYQMVRALARQYGFMYVFVMPPRLLLGNKPLTPEEQAMQQEAVSEAAFATLSSTVYHTLARTRAHYPHLYSMLHIFDHAEGLIWIDEVHVTPIGNQLIAASLLDIIQARASEEK